jgi:hypothetical protein
MKFEQIAIKFKGPCVKFGLDEIYLLVKLVNEPYLLEKNIPFQLPKLF